MTFIHEDPEWSDLLRIVAEHLGRNVAVVEKDYWVTHALWALLERGFDIWFKGGTSLSKGFDLIERFSEDLDLRIDPGTVSGLPEVRSWKGPKQNQVERRRRFFEALTNAITVPGASVQLGPEGQDRYWRGAQLQVVYPIESVSSLPAGMRPFVLLELGMAKVTPSVDRDLTSWVHDWLEREGHLSSFADNRPREVRCTLSAGWWDLVIVDEATAATKGAVALVKSGCVNRPRPWQVVPRLLGRQKPSAGHPQIS